MSFFEFPFTPSDKDVAWFKDMMKTDYDTSYSDSEAAEGAYNLFNFFRMLIKMDRRLFLARKRVVDVLKAVLCKKQHKIYKNSCYE